MQHGSVLSGSHLDEKNTRSHLTVAEWLSGQGLNEWLSGWVAEYLSG